MNAISTSNLQFIPADIVYSKVKRRLQSYVSANLIDEGEFPVYTKDVLKRLGLGVYEECKGIVKIDKYQACLPDNFTYLHAAYKCSPFISNVKDKGHGIHLQSSSFSYNMDISDSIFHVDDRNCITSCCESSTGKMIEQISVLNYIQDGKNCELTFGNFLPLRLSPNVSPMDCTEDCEAKFNDSIFEISIKGKTLYTNFTDDCVFLKYYGFPMDDNGDLLIPDIEQVKNAIEWCIIYEVLLTFWFDSSVQDISNKWQEAQVLYSKWFAEAKYYLKLPTFVEMINQLRNQRSQNKLVYLTRQYSDGNFQRSH